MTKTKVQMTNKDQGSNVKVYDLEERTSRFGEDVIAFARTLPKDIIVAPLIGQIVRSGTSVAANYMEADTALTRKDFRYKLSICRKEAKETMHWFRMISHACPGHKKAANQLQQESRELVLIFSTILHS